MSLFTDIISSMQDPKLRHAAIVHLPIGLSIIGPAAAIAALALPKHRATLRWVTLSIFALFTLAAFAAAQAGEQAIVGVGTLTTEARAVLNDHASLAGYLWLGGLATLIASAGLFAPQPKLRTIAAFACAALASALAAWTGIVGHYGGTAVHVYGINAPTPPPTTTPADALADPRALYFRAQVAPIFESKCVWCHAAAPDTASGLDLTSAPGLLKGGHGGPAVIPGDAKASVLYQAITHTHATLKMPKNGGKLDDAQIAIIAKWINDGCVWESKR